jgi:hypothetical protein
MPEEECAMTHAQLVKRVERLEREMVLLKRSVNELKARPPRPTSEDFIGMFHDDPYFERAMKLGRAYRRSLNPYRRQRKKRQK